MKESALKLMVRCCMVKLEVDGVKVDVKEGCSILQAVKKAKKDLPTLCYEEGLRPVGSCRACLVEVEGNNILVPACTTIVERGMVVNTKSSRAMKARKLVLELLMADHPTPCRGNVRARGCSLEKFAAEYSANNPRFPVSNFRRPVDPSNPAIIFDPSCCVLCYRCVRACNDIQVNEVIGLTGRSAFTKVSFDLDDPMGKSACVTCGECVAYCPTGALMEKSIVQDFNSLENLELP